MDTPDKDPGDVAGALRQLISANFNIDLPAGAALLDHGLSFDSVSLVQLIVLLEEHFQILFDEDELRVESFNDLDRLATLVRSKLGP